ncbi:MAG: hypothetical protein MI974_04670 [Chitinophagales bacterium]|nr:hypothetical protein [Chitinophagales bacterium]
MNTTTYLFNSERKRPSLKTNLQIRRAIRIDDNTSEMPDPALIKNFGLTAEEFDRLVNQLRRGNEDLFQAIFLAHFEDCMKYLSQRYGLQHEKAYDITMDALLLFRKRLLENKIHYGNIRFLFTQMASQLYLKELKRPSAKAEVSELQDLLYEETEYFDDEILSILNKAWDKLCDDCRGLLKRFYYHKSSLKEIAQEQQKNAAALRKQKQRCVEKLRQHFNQLYQF